MKSSKVLQSFRLCRLSFLVVRVRSNSSAALPKSRCSQALNTAIKLTASSQIHPVGFSDPTFVFSQGGGLAVQIARDGRSALTGCIHGFEHALAGKRIKGQSCIADREPTGAADGPAYQRRRRNYFE